MKLKDTCSWKESCANLDSISKSKDITFPVKVHIFKAMGFPVVVWIHKLDHKEGWVLKNWCFQIVLEKTLESPLDSREIKPVNLKGDQPWIFIRRTSAEAPVLWSCDKKSWLTGKDPDAGNDWGQEKGTTEVEMVGWHHRLNEHELDQHELGDSNEQGSLVCCSPWGRRVGHDLGSEQQQWLIMISTFPCAFFFFF